MHPNQPKYKYFLLINVTGEPMKEKRSGRVTGVRGGVGEGDGGGGSSFHGRHPSLFDFSNFSRGLSSFKLVSTPKVFYF